MTNAASFCLGVIAITLWALWSQGARLNTLLFFGLILGAVLRLTITQSEPGTLFHIAVATPLIFISCIALQACYLFSRSLFQEEEPMSRRDWLILSVTVMIIGVYTVLFQLLPRPEGKEARQIIIWSYHPIQTVFTLYYFIQTIRVILRNYGDDLIEDRRRFRLILVTIVSVSILLLSIGYLFSILGLVSSEAFLFSVSPNVALLLAVILCPMVLRPRGLAAFRGWPRIIESEALPSGRVALEENGLDLSQLRRLMDEDKLYRRAGLSIGALANTMALSEHELRALINKGLGYRNFNQFLNSYRLADAKAMLADHEQRRVPILTIALDLGFGSAQSFNRIFKSETGVAPSEYREEACKAA